MMKPAHLPTIPPCCIKIILLGYSRSIVSSRAIAKACEENIVFMALSGDSRPHFTTIVNFITKMDSQVRSIFADVLLYCDQIGLIGRNMFAIDGCKLPSNASKEWSGTHKSLKRKIQKMRTETRTVAYFTGKNKGASITFSQRMKEKIDSDRGRAIYRKRTGTVEPLFANLRHILKFSRFTLRGKLKVNIQWNMLAVLHNMLKVHRFGP